MTPAAPASDYFPSAGSGTWSEGFPPESAKSCNWPPSRTCGGSWKPFRRVKLNQKVLVLQLYTVLYEVYEYAAAVRAKSAQERPRNNAASCFSYFSSVGTPPEKL